MRHRHLNHREFTWAAIDDIIDRGGREDWAELVRAIREQPGVLEDLRHICATHSDEWPEYPDQRYNIWRQYVRLIP